MTTASHFLPAVILAAGRGSRLGALTAERPKALLEVAGRSLLERQLDSLRAARIAPVYILTGFAREAFAGHLGGETVEIHNERWAGTNNLVTLAAAGDALNDGFLLFNADVLFHPGILEALLDAPSPCALAVDTRGPLAEEEMKVALDGEGRVTAIAKTLDPRTAAGEYIGLAKFDVEGALALRSVLDEILAEGRTGEWYEAAFQVLAGRLCLQACSTGDLPWTEIDTPADLARAEALAREQGW